jgi:hypothetical protein
MRKNEWVPVHGHTNPLDGGSLLNPGLGTGGSTGDPSGGGGGSATTAVAVSVADVAGYFTGADVEAVLAEIGAAGAGALNDMTDVTITSPATADRLRYDGSVWRNSTLIWTPVTVFDPTTGNYLPAVDGSGNQIMTEA